jgi:lysozyme family protein
MGIILDDKLKIEYQNLYDSCVINSSRAGIVGGLVNKIISNKARYEAAADRLKIPWQFVGVIHNMEASQNFNCHLHNGDPLSARTTHVPKGRPTEGNPPFAWEESAIDALTLRKVEIWQDWSIPGLLYQIEGYNGWGYKLNHPLVLSPYLWSFSNHYIKGKYVADGKWSDTTVSNQCGAAVLLKNLGVKDLV